jgi:hypothetical protein
MNHNKPKSPAESPESDAGIQGEGDYEAARRYNEKATEHARSADVEGEARDAEPADAREEDELEEAEEKGRARAKDEDPLLDEPERIERNADKTG